MTRLLTELPGASGPEAPALSAVVPVLNGGQRLVELVESLLSQEVPDGGLEILLADSGSDDLVPDRLRAEHPTLRFFEVQADSFDHGTVRSELVAAARAPLVAIFSQDALPQSHCLLRLMEAFENPQVAGAYCRQLPREGADPLLRATLERWTPSLSEPRLQFLKEGERWEDLSGERKMELARFDNVGSMVRRELVLEQPFPSTPFGEDILWGASMLRRGHAVAYVPQAEVEHSHVPRVVDTFKRHRAAHQQARRDFGHQAVPSLAALGQALFTGIPGDVRDGGLSWAVRGFPRRSAALLGQWVGGREGGDRE